MAHISRLVKGVIPAVTRHRAQFHSSARAMVKVGDAVPSIELVEASPGNKVNLANEIKGKALIIGVPAAFSMCICHARPSAEPEGLYQSNHRNALLVCQVK